MLFTLWYNEEIENGPVRGFGLIPGVFVGHLDSFNGFRVPHIEWNALYTVKDLETLDDIGNHHVYFVHSYHTHFSILLTPQTHHHALYLQFISNTALTDISCPSSCFPTTPSNPHSFHFQYFSHTTHNSPTTTIWPSHSSHTTHSSPTATTWPSHNLHAAHM